MAYAAHEAALDRVLKDGTTERENLEFAAYRAKNKSARAIRLLTEGPPCPDHLSYLLQHAGDLVGRSGIGMDGVSPLTFTTIRDYCALTHWTFEPWEVDALIKLDGVLRNPAPLEQRAKKAKPDAGTPAKRKVRK